MITFTESGYEQVLAARAESRRGRVRPGLRQRPRLLIAVIVALATMVGLGVVGSVTPASAAPVTAGGAAPSGGAASSGGAAPSGGAVQDLCSTPAAGYASCLSQRLVNPRPAVTASAAVTPASAPGGLAPADLAAAYELDTTKGYGQTVAIVDAYDDPTAAADLAVYRAQYGLPPCTVANGCFSKVNQTGTATPLPGANAGWAGEISLDLDMVSAICPQCDILLVEATSSLLSDLGTAVDTAVRLGAKFVSNSYGGGEYNGVGGNDVHFNHPGVAITASTGDNGYGVSYPATSPYVTAVGGTSLYRSSTARGWTESAWAGAGSGCSGYLAKPAVQATVNTGCANRAVADVSAVADPNTGVAVYGTYGGGGWGVYGGTSASSPIIASVYALAGTPGAADYPNIYPYASVSALNDVTAGTNGTCPVHVQCAAGAGWDGPTGLGTPVTAAAFSATGQVSGAPVKFGATGTIGSPVVAGLSTTATVTPILPDGDSFGSITWKAARVDCVLGSPAELSTTVSCPATAVGSTTVTATVRDSLGASKVVTLPLAFAAATSTKRAVAITLSLPGQSDTQQSICVGAATPVVAQVTDAATGAPVRGVTVTFARQTSTAAPTTFGSAVSGPDGTATSTLTSTVGVVVSARSGAIGAFSAFTGASMTVTAAVCVASLTGTAALSASYYGDAVSVTGSLTRDASGRQVPISGVRVQITETIAGKSQLLTSVLTGVDGAVSAVVHPTASGTLNLVLPVAAGWHAVTTVVGPLTVALPTTVLTADSAARDVGYADAVTVSGTLLRVAGDSSAAPTAATVTVRETASTGAMSTLASAPVTATGDWSVVVRPRASGTITAVYAGRAGLPAASAAAGTVTVGLWTPTVTMTAQLTQQVAGAANKMSGSVTRVYGSESGPAAAVPVKIYLVTTTGAQSLLSTVATTAAGAFTSNVLPLENGTLVARLATVPGYVDADSAGVPVSVASGLTATAPTVVAVGKPVPVTVVLSAGRVGTVSIDRLDGSVWTPVASGTTPATGRVVVQVPALAAGKQTLRASFAGDSRGGASTSANVVVTVR